MRLLLVRLLIGFLQRVGLLHEWPLRTQRHVIERIQHLLTHSPLGTIVIPIIEGVGVCEERVQVRGKLGVGAQR